MEQEKLPVDSLVPQEVQEAIESLENSPGKEKISTFLSSISMMVPVSPQLEMAKKIQPEHITQIIKLDEQRLKQEEELNKRIIEDEQKKRQHQLWQSILFGSFFLILVLILKDSPNLLLDLMKILLGAAGGLGIGYYKGKKDTNSDN